MTDGGLTAGLQKPVVAGLSTGPNRSSMNITTRPNVASHQDSSP